MQLVIRLDEKGLVAVEICTNSLEEQHEAHRLFEALRPELEKLDAAIKRYETER
jgi:hypothetical protein